MRSWTLTWRTYTTRFAVCCSQCHSWVLNGRWWETIQTSGAPYWLFCCTPCSLSMDSSGYLSYLYIVRHLYWLDIIIFIIKFNYFCRWCHGLLQFGCLDHFSSFCWPECLEGRYAHLVLHRSSLMRPNLLESDPIMKPSLLWDNVLLTYIWLFVGDLLPMFGSDWILLVAFDHHSPDTASLQLFLLHQFILQSQY